MAFTGSSRTLNYRVVSRSDEEDRGPARSNLETSLVRQLDLMQNTSEVHREKVMKKNWVSEVERFYNLVDTKNPVPTFRPRVLVPEIQMEMLAEASDLSDVSPLPYIVNKRTGTREEAREKALQAVWKTKDFNLSVLQGVLWSLFAGNGYLRVGFDPDAANGMGEVCVTAPHPASVYPDPFALSDENMKYVIYEDFMYIDEVRQRWGKDAYRVKFHRPGAPSALDTTLQMPEGPMSAISGFPGATDSASGMASPDESRVRVRTAFVRDYSVKRFKEPPKQIGVLAFPKALPAYPDGRLLIECEGVILLDRPNPFPLKLFPNITIHGFPALTSFFAPPPINYTYDLQKLAERMLTQTFENAIRVNNVITFIYEGSGIDPEEFGGVPGGVHMINDGSKPPEMKSPPAFPQHMVEMPAKLLEMVKELNGFTPARKGITGAGNISAPLMDASVLQSQSLTRLRARLLAKSFRRLAWVVFATMARFYTQNRTFPTFYPEDEGIKYLPVNWDPLVEETPGDFELQVDEASIRPFSQVTLRQMVPTLRQLGMIDQQSGLELLDIPNAEIVKERLAKEAEAQARMAAMGVKPKSPSRKK